MKLNSFFCYLTFASHSYGLFSCNICTQAYAPDSNLDDSIAHGSLVSVFLTASDQSDPTDPQTIHSYEFRGNHIGFCQTPITRSIVLLFVLVIGCFHSYGSLYVSNLLLSIVAFG